MTLEYWFDAGRLATARRFAQEEAVSRLSEKRCVPCREGMPPVPDAEAKAMLAELDGWTISTGPRLGKTWKFPDFATALAFVNRQPFVASNIIGATTLDQLKADIDSVNVQLSQEVLDGIEAIHRDQPNPSA